jgi:hypothetical protein
MIIDLINARFEEERKRTKERLDQVLQYLSHDTSPTRKRLAEVLRQQAYLVESESNIDCFSAKYDMTGKDEYVCED